MANIRIRPVNSNSHTFFHTIVLILGTSYILYRAFISYIAPPLDISISITSDDCPYINSNSQYDSFGNGIVNQSLKHFLTTGEQTFAFTIPSTTKTLFFDLCSNTNTSIHNISMNILAPQKNSIDIPLSHLACFRCKIQKETHGLITITPTSSNPQLVITSVQQIIRQQLPFISYTNYISFAVFLLLIAYMITIFPVSNYLRILLVELLIISAYIVYRWERIRSLFPPPKITSQKIIGASHYFGYPTRSDNIIFITLIITLVALTAIYHAIWKKTKNPKQALVISGFTLFILIIAIEHYVK